MSICPQRWPKTPLILFHFVDTLTHFCRETLPSEEPQNRGRQFLFLLNLHTVDEPASYGIRDDSFQPLIPTYVAFYHDNVVLSVLLNIK